MANCSLFIADRIVVASDKGPLEAEYALFDESEIELFATEPGAIREIGYVTTVAKARERLERAGLTVALVNACEQNAKPVLAAAYARGPIVRSLTPHLAALELFEGGTYSSEQRRYLGTWLDLGAMSQDARMLRASVAIELVHLYALLAETDGDARVFLETEPYTTGRRAGERTFRRMSAELARNLPDALRALANAAPGLDTRGDVGPSRRELLEAISERLARPCQPGEKERLSLLERHLTAKPSIPLRGPLADPDLWELEARLATGSLNGVVQRLDVLESQKGKTPGLSYLRARWALAARAEPIQTLAERIAAMAQTSPDFYELSILAAEAWREFGDARRARAFARDVVDSRGASMAVRVRAIELLDAIDDQARPVSARPTSAHAPGEASRTSVFRIPAIEHPGSVRSGRPARPSVPNAAEEKLADLLTLDKPPSSRARVAPASPAADVSPSDDGMEPAPDTALNPSPVIAAGPVSKPAAPRPQVPRPSQAPPRPAIAPPDERTPLPGPVAGSKPAGLRSEMQAVDAASSDRPPPPPSDAMRSAKRISDAPRSTDDALAHQVVPPPPRIPAIAQLSPVAPGGLFGPAPDSVRSNMPTIVPASASGRPLSEPPQASTGGISGFPVSRGGSMPPYRTDHTPRPPSVPIVGTPMPPRVLDGPADLAETLSLPPGLHGQPPPRDALPKTYIDARVAFTYLSRELGRFYRTQLGVTLKTDVAGIEAMQRYLHDRFPTEGDAASRSAEDTHELRRHGAFLSEVIARTLGAYWIDVSPQELGYWAMIVPPSIRVWPFGRVLRFVQTGYRERDLAAYFLELQVRARQG